MENILIQHLEDVKQSVCELGIGLKLHDRLTAVECQSDRTASDAESEKRTRSESNKEIWNHFGKVDDKLSAISRLVYIGLGIVITLEFIILLIHK